MSLSCASSRLKMSTVSAHVPRQLVPASTLTRLVAFERTESSSMRGRGPKYRRRAGGEHVAQAVERDSRRDNGFDRPRNPVADRVHVREAAARDREIAVEDHPAAAGCSRWPTRRRGGDSDDRPRSCPRRRRRRAPNRAPSIHHETLDCRCGMATVRSPLPLLWRDERRDAIDGSPVDGSRVIVAPRASLLWKP